MDFQITRNISNKLNIPKRPFAIIYFCFHSNQSDEGILFSITYIFLRTYLYSYVLIGRRRSKSESTLWTVINRVFFLLYWARSVLIDLRVDSYFLKSTRQTTLDLLLAKYDVLVRGIVNENLLISSRMSCVAYSRSKYHYIDGLLGSIIEF